MPEPKKKRNRWSARVTVKLDDTALRDRAAELNLPWRRVADRAGLNWTTLCAKRRGRRPISADEVARLERALALAPGSLLLADDSEAQESASLCGAKLSLK